MSENGGFKVARSEFFSMVQKARIGQNKVKCSDGPSFTSLWTGRNRCSRVLPGKCGLATGHPSYQTPISCIGGSARTEPFWGLYLWHISICYTWCFCSICVSSNYWLTSIKTRYSEESLAADIKPQKRHLSVCRFFSFCAILAISQHCRRNNLHYAFHCVTVVCCNQFRNLGIQMYA